MSATISGAPQPRPVDARTQALADAYNRVPYQSKPFSQSSPEQMAVMASLFGLKPPDLASARVLEIGCSSGGNLIPLALRFPGMQCVGIDISDVEIAHGRQLIQSLNISNCDLRILDVAQAGNSLGGPFDYIVCHGVFSWVPPKVSEAILDTVRDQLAPDGVAYISYNVYPGWKMREVVREMMMFHAGGFDDPAQRLAQGKAILDFTKRLSGEQSTYGKLLRDEAGLVSQAEDYYLLHEYLELENHPMYFRDFMKLAAQRQLAYLGEAHLADMAPQRLGAEVLQTLARLSQGNILATEQYMDLFTNRTFRQTLLVHEAQAGRVSRNLSGDALARFALSTAMRPSAEPVPAGASPGQHRYQDNFGRTLASGSIFSQTMMDTLIEAQPHALNFDALVAGIQKRLSAAGHTMDDTGIARSLGGELLNLLVQNVVRLHPRTEGPGINATHPTAFLLAREQARRRQSWATSVTHNPVNISTVHAIVLEMLDGSKDRQALAEGVLRALESGALQANQNGQLVRDLAQLRTLAGQFLDQALADFKGMGLLV
jgi:methyltransferase-like protein/trans-aconitate methyltransferase